MLSLRRLAHIGRKVPKVAAISLFGGRQIGFGNRIAPNWDSKTRRTWKPNVQWASLYSKILNESIRIRVTTHLLRTVDKKGGLDNYLLHTKSKNIASEAGLKLKARIKQIIKTQPATPETPAI
ncbi:hypothetical protein H4R33_005078 [Dimargaris cristalligena]|uniref:Large ribosomal subunit protein bL28m n=1 Tax=Dimargaris cristalligena TaxID=215637 RepID=A0A4P9ZTR5_9FUNG|nr:hypothetical protein H4R33_005078 [Dimargaris cristalligena]RKP36986.1 ribosomal L28 family-domain-containing protein [Dimargaris cristalligena]|eukprot:RKP36986.1 ribosomal L28 family-domain-containing protein [Dimargaris cristalligena]